MLLWTAENTATALLLGGLALLACRWLPTRPALCHFLWLLVLVRLIAPPVPIEGWPGVSVSQWMPEPEVARPDVATLPSVPLELPSEEWKRREAPAPESEAEAKAAGKKEKDAEWMQPVAWLGAVDGPGAAAPPPRPSGVSTLLASAGRSLESARSPLLWIWGLGALAVLGIQVARVRRFHRRARAARPAPVVLLEIVDDVAQRLGVRAPEVRVLPGLGSPVIWSCGRTMLLWPETRTKDLHTTRGRGIVAHELAHLRRRDHWIAWLEVLTIALLWWNPVMWFARRRMRRYAELSSDAWAVWAYPNQRRDYAEALIDVAESLSARRTRALANPSVLAVTDDEPKDFERRLTMIMRERVSCRVSPLWTGLAVVVTALALPSWSTAQSGDRIVAGGLDLDVAPAVTRALLEQEASAAYDADDWKAAAAAYDRLSHQRPDDGWVFEKLGMANYHLERWTEAIEAFGRQSRLGHDASSAEYNIACVHALAGDSRSAFEALHRAIDTGYDDASWIQEDADLASLQDDPRLGGVLERLESLHALLKTAKETDGALGAFRQLVEAKPRDGEAWASLGYAALKAGQYGEAAEAFTRQADLNHRKEVGLYNAACGHSLGGRTDRALSMLDAALDAGFDDFELLRKDEDLTNLRAEPRMAALQKQVLKVERRRREADLAADFDDWEATADAWNDVIAAHPDDAGAHAELGLAMFRMGEYGRAIEVFSRQAQLGHHVDKALYNMACGYAMLGRADKAMAHLEQAVDLGLTDMELIRNDPDLGILRDDPRLEQLAQRADDAGVLRNFGATSWQQLRAKALDKLDEDAEDGRAYHHLGWAHLRSGDYEAALEAFQRQDAAGYSTETARYNVACCYAKLGRTEEAFEWLQLALDEGVSDVHHVASDPDLLSLRGDPRFAAMLEAASSRDWQEREAKERKVKEVKEKLEHEHKERHERTDKDWVHESAGLSDGDGAG